ncbi:MAG: hypothetical protein ACKVZ0_22655 [Gemmatimonadales bacterium]
MAHAVAASDAVQTTCHLSFAFEVGQGIDLEVAERLLSGTERQTVRSRRRVPQYFEYRPAPLRVGTEQLPPQVASLRPLRAEIVLYDFGAAAVNYSYHYAGPLEGLVAVGSALQAVEAGLAADARQRVTAMIHRLPGALSRPGVAPEVEDYLIFQLDQVGGQRGLRELIGESGPTLAQILRSAACPLSMEETDDALAVRLSYGSEDLSLIDWNAAIIFDSEPDETRAVLEFANVQLLEFRHLDGQLDQAVDRAYQALARTERGWIHRLRPPTAAFRQQALYQMDAAVLFERVSNALKLVGDQFLSRVYRAVSARFHLDDWDRGITRKLDVLDRIYQKIGDQVSARRLEILEWIVIVLIALELVLR